MAKITSAKNSIEICLQNYWKNVLSKLDHSHSIEKYDNISSRPNIKPFKEWKEFECKICEKKFRFLSVLKKHEQIHSGVKPFKCNQCDYKCSQSNALNYHKRIHSAERPFGCDQCGKEFKYLGHLKVHKRIHTNERPFKCEQCDKKFSQSCSLKAHKQLHVKKKQFKCDYKCTQLSSIVYNKPIHTG